jgi:hypothetical protein
MNIDGMPPSSSNLPTGVTEMDIEREQELSPEQKWDALEFDEAFGIQCQFFIDERESMADIWFGTPRLQSESRDSHILRKGALQWALWMGYRTAKMERRRA